MGFNKENLKKVGKTALYLAVSAAIGGVLAETTQNPELFGVVTPIVNLLLVAVRQYVKEN